MSGTTVRVHVVRPGPLTTVQDLGRPGSAHLGVPRSGALDGPAHRLAARLVGNPPWAAGLETTFGDLALRAHGTVTVAVTGAPCPVRVDGRPAPWGAPFRVPDGALLEVGRPSAGVRAYVALAGGVDVPPVLGSRSTDLLAGVGPAPLAAGDVLPLGSRDRPGFGTPAACDTATWSGPPSELVLPLVPGPRTDWFAPDTLALLARAVYAVSSASNRVGLRTEGGEPLVRSRREELPSEGMVLGAVQVPPNGLPVVFLADHPTTGGYPVVGVVPEDALGAAAQAASGTPLRFVPLGGS